MRTAIYSKCVDNNFKRRWGYPFFWWDYSEWVEMKIDNLIPGTIVGTINRAFSADQEKEEWKSGLESQVDERNAGSVSVFSNSIFCSC